MTTATGSAEVPFLSGMEREPPKKEDWQEVTVTLDSAGKKAWRLDGMLHRILEVAGHAFGKMRSHGDRGPADYPESDFERGMRAGARIPGHNYGGTVNPNGSGKLVAWILGVFGAASTLLLGLMLQSQYSLRADVSELKGQVSILVQDRNRGNNDGRSP